jgi:ribosomal protein L37AE/L43A
MNVCPYCHSTKTELVRSVIKSDIFRCKECKKEWYEYDENKRVKY